MRVLFLIVLTFGLLASCKKKEPADSTSTNSEVVKAQTLEAQVIAVHDEAMPRTNEIRHLIAQLRNIKAGLKETPEGKIVSPEGLDKTMESLKLAELGMTDWMNSYYHAKPTITDDQMETFMKKQLEEITKVKRDIDSSIENAKAWIAAYSSQAK